MVTNTRNRTVCSRPIARRFLPTQSTSRILPPPPAHGTGANDHQDRSGAGGRCPRRGFFRRSSRPGRPRAPAGPFPTRRGLWIGPLERPARGVKIRQRTRAPLEGRGCRIEAGVSRQRGAAEAETAGHSVQGVGQTPRGMPEADRMTLNSRRVRLRRPAARLARDETKRGPSVSGEAVKLKDGTENRPRP